jgi:hypothetical protein
MVDLGGIKYVGRRQTADGNREIKAETTVSIIL